MDWTAADSCGMLYLNVAWRGEVRHGSARLGKARHDRRGEAGPGEAWHGSARRGKARPDRHGNEGCRALFMRIEVTQ